MKQARMNAAQLRTDPTPYARPTGKSRWRHGPALPQDDAWAEGLWNDHGPAVYSLALALLGDEATALQAVALGMVDFARWDVGTPASGTRRTLSRRVHRRSSELASGTPVTAGLPPLMGRLSRLADLQRAAYALCVFGGHAYRDAAEVLGIAPSEVAQLLSSSLAEFKLSSPQVAG